MFLIATELSGAGKTHIWPPSYTTTGRPTTKGLGGAENSNTASISKNSRPPVSHPRRGGSQAEGELYQWKLFAFPRDVVLRRDSYKVLVVLFRDKAGDRLYVCFVKALGWYQTAREVMEEMLRADQREAGSCRDR